MDIVSIRKYLRPEKPRAVDYIRLLQLLLKGISAEAVEANERELASFRKEVSDISEKLSVESTAGEIEIAVDFVLRAVAGYNGMASRTTKAHVHELQDMLAMMSKTIAFLSDSSQTGIQQLHAVEKNLQSASTIQDVRQLRTRLNDCLALVRSESNRLHEESRKRIVELQAGMERTALYVREAGITVPERAPAAAPRPLSPRVAAPDDSLTGLQGRDAAEARIAASIGPEKEFALTLFLVDRFTHLNGKYGNKVGDQVLLLVAQHLREHLDTGSLYRWSGPAFVHFRETARAQYEIEQDMLRIASRRFEKTIEEDRRMVLLPISCSCIVQKVSDADSLEGVVGILDDFVAAKASEYVPDHR